MGYILVTGGTGFIGSHVCVEMLFQGYKVIAVDNFANSNAETLFKIRKMTGCFYDNMRFFKVDLHDEAAFTKIVKEHEIDACIHLAGSKAVGESVERPLDYYDNNMGTTITLLRVLDAHNIHRIVFSSSATVYGNPEALPITESAQLCATNPYGRTKLYLESMFHDLAQSDPKWQILLLRYFNPIGAHPTGLIGEDPDGIPNNLMPYVAQVAVGKRDRLTVFGDDYDTPDGTCLRDYIHVCDLAEGHIAALNRLLTESKDPVGCVAVNLGTGKGTSVLELVSAMRVASGKVIPCVMGDRRAGDAEATYCDPHLASEILGWKATRGIADMCRDTWIFQSGETRFNENIVI